MGQDGLRGAGEAGEAGEARDSSKFYYISITCTQPGKCISKECRITHNAFDDKNNVDCLVLALTCLLTE